MANVCFTLISLYFIFYNGIREIVSDRNYKENNITSFLYKSKQRYNIIKLVVQVLAVVIVTFVLPCLYQLSMLVTTIILLVSLCVSDLIISSYYQHKLTKMIDDKLAELAKLSKEKE